MRSTVLRWLLCINIVGLSILLAFVFDVESQLEATLDWIGRHPWLGASLFIAIYAASTGATSRICLFMMYSSPVWLQVPQSPGPTSTSDALTSQSVPHAVLVVPASLFQVAAGAVFGLWLGCLIAWVGCTLGMVATFIMGR